MNFFTLDIISNTRGRLYQSDIEPKAFEGFAKLFASELVHYRIFNNREMFAMRLVPRWTGEINLKKPELLDARTLAPLTRAFLDIVFEEPARPEPVKFLTLRWHSADRNLIYQQDLPVDSTFQALINLAVSLLLEKGVLSEGEKFRYEIFARNEGLPTIDPDLFTQSLIYPTVDAPLIQPETPSERPKREFQISITGKTPLITSKPKSLSGYDMVEAVRQLASGALRIYVQRSVWLSLDEPKKLSRENKVEVVGALVGGVFTDDSGEPYVEVTEAIPVPEAQGDFYNVRIDPEIWRSLIEKVNIRYPNREKVLVGWYHTHLIAKLNMAQSADASGEMQASRQTFLSGEDIFIHDSFFSQPWHIALVLDLNRNQDVFFHRKDKKLVDCGGFFLFSPVYSTPTI